VTVISTFALRNAAAYSSGSERVTTALDGICILPGGLDAWTWTAIRLTIAWTFSRKSKTQR